MLCGKQHERIARAGSANIEGPKGDLMHYDRSICEKGSQPRNVMHDGIVNIVARSTEFLKKRTADDPPFFLYIAPHEAHSKWDSDDSRYAQPPVEAIELPAYLPKLEWLKEPYRQFLGSVHHADKTLMGLMDTVENLGLDENTIVVFTTDHGESFRRAKGTLYEAAVAVPLVIRWPGVITPGSVSDELVSNLDLRPTLVSAAGGKPDAEIDGRNLIPALRGEAFSGPRFIFSERDFHSSYKTMRAVRDDRFKLILIFSSQPDRATVAELADAENWTQLERKTGANGRRMAIFELYDLASDPNETRNLAALPEHRGTRDALQDELYLWMNETDDYLRGAASMVFFPRRSVQRLGM